MERQPSTFIGKKKPSTIQMATVKTKFWSEARTGLSKMALKCCFYIYIYIYIYIYYI